MFTSAFRVFGIVSRISVPCVCGGIVHGTCIADMSAMDDRLDLFVIGMSCSRTKRWPVRKAIV